MSVVPPRFFVQDIVLVLDGHVTEMRVGNPLLSDPRKCWLEAVSAESHDQAVAAAYAAGFREGMERAAGIVAPFDPDCDCVDCLEAEMRVAAILAAIPEGEA
ncbi:MAG: hypothetical protein ACRCXM_08865 [Beijerinckiaceae bacterium]